MWLMPIAALVEVLITINVMRSIGFIPPLVVFVVILAAHRRPGVRPPGTTAVPGRRHRAAAVRRAEPPVRHRRSHRPDRDQPRMDRHHRHRRGRHRRDRRDRGVRRAASRPARRPGLARPRAAWSSPCSSSALLVGTSYVSIRGYSALEGTPGLGVANGVVTAPAQAPVELDAVGTAFSQKTLQLRAGPGTVYVVNADSDPHTFDIELNGRVLSYPVPAGPRRPSCWTWPAAGTYTYWCAIPGHRSSMEGTLEVTQ